ASSLADKAADRTAAAARPEGRAAGSPAGRRADAPAATEPRTGRSSPAGRPQRKAVPRRPVAGGRAAAPTRPHGTGRAEPQPTRPARSEEHTSELQSRFDLVCRLLLEKKKI